MTKPDIIAAHKHSIRHRDEIFRSNICGCFCCLHIFPPTKIVSWTDSINGIGQTAICPHCSVDAIIGSDSGYPITPKFLAAMEKHWFNLRDQRKVMP